MFPVVRSIGHLCGVVKTEVFMGERATNEQREEGRRLAAARVRRGLKQSEIAVALRVDSKTVGRWENGRSAVRLEQRISLAEILGVPLSEIWAAPKPATEQDTNVPRGTYRTPMPVARVVREVTRDVEAWPQGWTERAYALQLEAAKAGATEEELAAVRGWMLDPGIQALWHGGIPRPEQMHNLDGIEIGARAWLRGRGRKVKAR
jgi:transcriptional regulator with XRE-family HTH domain